MPESSAAASSADPPSLLMQTLDIGKKGRNGVESNQSSHLLLNQYNSLRDNGKMLMFARRLQEKRGLIRVHGLYLTSDMELHLPNKHPPTYWGQLARSKGRMVLEANPNVFRKGNARIWQPGVRNSTNHARRDGVTVKRLGSNLIVSYHPSFNDKAVSQSQVEKLMGKTAKIKGLREQLRMHLLSVIHTCLEQPINPPGIAFLNIQRLHDAFQATANQGNPQPWLLSRAQIIAVILETFEGLDRSLLNRLCSSYDPQFSDRIRFAEITANLMAASHPSTVVLGSRTEDYGPYKYGLTMFRQAFRFYTSNTSGPLGGEKGRNLRLAILHEMVRSPAISLHGLQKVEKAYQNFMRIDTKNAGPTRFAAHMDKGMNEGELIALLKEEGQLISTYQDLSMEFQAQIALDKEKELVKKNTTLKRIR